MEQQKNINDNKLPLIKINTILYNSTNSQVMYYVKAQKSCLTKCQSYFI